MLSVCLRNVVFPRNFPSGKLPIPVNNTGILPVSGILLLVAVADTKMYYFHVLPIAKVILFRQFENRSVTPVLSVLFQEHVQYNYCC